MIKFKYLIKVKFFLVYTFFYLISTGLANGKSSKNEIFFDLENGLNRRDIKVIRQYFEEKESDQCVLKKTDICKLNHD